MKNELSNTDFVMNLRNSKGEIIKSICKKVEDIPSASVIDVEEELESKTSEYLYNKVRMLADPYPNAYIKTVDGRKLIIKSVEVQ
jgi:hypothetical protein